MELTRTTATDERIVEEKKARHHVGILLLFCTFAECWMEHLLKSLMLAHRLPAPIMDRLLSDSERIDKRKELFKALTGKAFGDALREISEENKNKGGDLNYEEIWSFVHDTIKTRNKVVHSGAVHAFSETLTEEAIYAIPGVNGLFISLHNRYVTERSQPSET